MNFCGMQADFAAAAEGHALRRGHDGLWRVFDGEVYVLELLHGHVQFVPLLLLRADEHQHEIRANAKVDGLIGDDHGVEIGVQALDALVDHRDQVCADRVHLAVKFAAYHAVAEIDEAGTRVALDFAAGVFQIFEDSNADGLYYFLDFTGGKIEHGSFALAGFVETGEPGRQSFLKNQRESAPLFLNLRGKRGEPERVHDFKRTKLPGKAPAHGAIHIHNVVGDLRHAAPRVQAHFGDAAPDKLLRLVALLAFKEWSKQAAQAFGSIFDGFAGFDRAETRLLLLAVLHGVEVERENLPFTLAAFDAFVKSLAGFVAQP